MLVHVELTPPPVFLFFPVFPSFVGDENQNLTRREIMHRYIVYGEKYMSDPNLMLKQHQKSAIRALLKPVFWMFKGVHSGGRFRNCIETQCGIKPMPSFRTIVENGLSIMNPTVLDCRPNDQTILDPCGSRLGAYKICYQEKFQPHKRSGSEEKKE